MAASSLLPCEALSGDPQGPSGIAHLLSPGSWEVEAVPFSPGSYFACIKQKDPLLPRALGQLMEVIGRCSSWASIPAKHPQSRALQVLKCILAL